MILLENVSFIPYVQSQPNALISMMSLSMTFAMSMIVLQEHVFVSAVRRKCHSCYAQTREAAFKSVESRERSCVSPCLPRFIADQKIALYVLIPDEYLLTHARAHGSFAGVPADAANAFGSKPVRFGRGALRTLPSRD
jgi:hypothetical protein